MRYAAAAAAALFALLASPATGRPAPAAPPSPVANPKWGPDDHHQYAVRCLIHGRTFARAALHAEEAARREPEKYSHHLTLASALVSRHAALGFTFAMNENLAAERRAYPAQRAEWEQKRREAEAKGETHYEEAPPEPPALPFPARDDGKPMPASREAVGAEMGRLRADAVAAFERARGAARTPAEQAEVAHARGWGLALLNIYGMVEATVALPPAEAENGPPPSVVAGLGAGMRGALRSLERATELAPDNAAYHESLGCVREVMKELGQEAGGNDVKGAAKPAPGAADDHAPAAPTAETAWEAYDAALRLAPRNAPLWLKKAWREREKAPADREAVRACLAAAAKADPANALYRYALAAFEFEAVPFAEYRITVNLARMRSEGREVRRTPEQDGRDREAVAKATSEEGRVAGAQALRALEWGNAAPRAVAVRYRPPVPKTLAHAWSYMGAFLSSNTAPSVGETVLAGGVAGYAYALAGADDMPGAVRALDSLRAMGEKLLGEWPVRDAKPDSGEVGVASSGRYAVGTALGTRARILRQAGDTDGAARAQAAWDAFEARAQEWLAARKAAARSRWEEAYAGRPAD